jgi:exodeoxyribonuclease I
MTAPTFYWHDYETWGKQPRRDRPAQFAGLRTDADLNEIGDVVSVFCQPPDDILPDPESVLITGLTPQRARAEGLPEHEFAARIEALLGAPGTIGVGYNSIRFDDEVTRHLFWRNLIDPYAREWRDGNGRWDLLDVVRCTWALRPEGIEWPLGADGKPSFRLELLTAANGLAHEAAHEALSDVRATLAMARLVRQRQPRLWEFCLKLHKKDEVWREIGIGKPFVHLSGRYPSERGCMAIVWPLGSHPVNKNELIVWDLAHDPRELESLDADTARRRLFTRSDELAEGETRLPIKTIHLNKSPIVIGNLRTLGGAAQRFGLDAETAQAHAAHAARLPDLGALWKALFDRGPMPVADVDEDLYGGFIGRDDRRTLDRLRTLPPAQLAGRRTAFEDGRLEELVFRWRARNFPNTLDAEDAARWERHRAARLHEGAGGLMPLAAWFERLDALAEDATERSDERAQALLEALYDHAESIAPERA